MALAQLAIHTPVTTPMPVCMMQKTVMGRVRAAVGSVAQKTKKAPIGSVVIVTKLPIVMLTLGDFSMP